MDFDFAMLSTSWLLLHKAVGEVGGDVAVVEEDA